MGIFRFVTKTLNLAEDRSEKKELKCRRIVCNGINCSHRRG